MRLHVASLAVTTCCLLLRLEALVTLPQMALRLAFERSSMQRTHPRHHQQHHHCHQQQYQQLRLDMGTKHTLNCHCSFGVGRKPQLSLPARWTTPKTTPLQQQQRRQGSSRGDARWVPGKHAGPEALLARWGAASSDTGGGGEESNALLLRMDFEDADVEGLRNWIRRYPFGVALPVQPFSLVETEMGVDVIFRKKPTLGRGSQDGGLAFTVVDSGFQEGVDLPSGPALIMRRNSEGQEIRKMFAERIVVKAIVKSLAGDGPPPPPAGTKVRAVLHEGLV